jgi:hypothetical protein
MFRDKLFTQKKKVKHSRPELVKQKQEEIVLGKRLDTIEVSRKAVDGHELADRSVTADIRSDCE